MEPTISKSLVGTAALSPLVLRLHHRLSGSPFNTLGFPGRLIAHRLTRIYATRFRCVGGFVPGPVHSPLRSRILAAEVPSRGLRCFFSSASHFAAAGDTGGSGGGFGGEGGGGDGGSDGGDAKQKPAAAASEEASALPSDVIILDVRGMTCGGCAASVKRILENQAQVSSATVNLTTETAIVWPISEAKAVPNWQKELGEALAKHLTNCGFSSTPRGQEAIEGDVMA